MFVRRLFPLALALLLCAAASRVRPVSASDEGFQPISPEELAMTSEPQAPGAPAIILFHQVDRDDTRYREYNYFRIKILKEEGRKRADIEIPFIKGKGDVYNIKARTIRPDGSIANFDGKVYEKTVAKSRSLKYLAKTFTLPDIQVGSIIEYYFSRDWEEHYVYDSHWILSDDLFIKHAKFSLKPSTHFAVRWSWKDLPAGTSEPKNEDKFVRMEASNIPAFQTEDFMPPENELKARVDFVYTEDSLELDVDRFWKKHGKKLNEKVESFVGKRKAMEEAVAQIVAPDDPPEAKLHKIYARVQQLRNTSYEVSKTEQEAKRERPKEVKNVEDLWKQGYGDSVQLTWLFLALVRAANLEAYPVVVSARNEYFFNPKLMNTNQLDANVVLVKLNGKDIFCDPGAAFTPFGMLPWPETAVKGLRLDKDGGSWVTTTLPAGAESRIERKARLKLTEEGALEGKLTVTFTGLEALRRRRQQRNEDEASHKTFLEDQVRESVPAGIEVELTNKPEWASSATALVAEYNLKVPGWASAAGRRAVIAVGLFGSAEKRIFENTTRIHPIYLDYPFEREDEVTIDLPLGWKVSSLPPPQKQDGHVVAYSLKAESDKGTLHLTRKLTVDFVEIDSKYYPALRNFFQVLKTQDEQQIVLQPADAAASN